MTRHAQSTQNKFAYLCSISRKEIDILPSDKHKYFLPVGRITLAVHDQAFSKHPKQQLHNVFAISEGKCEGWS